MEPIECSETSAFNIQTPGKYPEENLPYLQHGESLKTMIRKLSFIIYVQFFEDFVFVCGTVTS
jgi:hypothetical protein